MIAHRGNLYGPDSELENDPQYVLEALAKGFDCEIDVHYVEGAWYLGHDGPDFAIPESFLTLPGLWIHCKNVPAVYQLQHTTAPVCNWFWHETDTMAITSKGFIWTSDPSIKGPKVVRMISNNPWTEMGILPYTGFICNDWVAVRSNHPAVLAWLS
jgi:hypothetical protein